MRTPFCRPNWVPPPSWPGSEGGGVYPAGGGYLTWVTPPAGYPPILAWGVPCWGRGVPYLGTPHPDLAGGYPAGGYPTWVPPSWPGWGGTLPGSPHPWQCTPPSWPGRRGTLTGGGSLPGYPPILTWQGPPTGPGWLSPPPCLPHGILGNVAKHYGIRVPPLVFAPRHSWVMLQSIMGIWVPPPRGQTEGQTRVKTLPSHRTTYAGRNKLYEV